jgi:hypothetical protein
MSSTCSSCLGELDSWNRAVARRIGVRPLALIQTDDPRYFSFVDSLLAPQYGVLKAEPHVMDALRAFRVPLVYELDAHGRVRSSALGVAASAAARTRIVDANAPSSGSEFPQSAVP